MRCQMPVKNIKLILFWMWLGFLTTSCAFSSAQNSIESLHSKIIHQLIPDNFLKVIDKSVHAQLLTYIEANPLAHAALEKLQPFDNPSFSLDKLIHDQDPEISKSAAYIRRFYLYVIYSHPSFSSITNFVPTNTSIHQTDLIYPESHIQLKEDELVFDEQEIDYLIIGSGPSGSLIASQLAQTKKVLLIEAGSFVKPGSINTEYNSDLMESFNQRHTLSGGIALRNGRAVGGGTTVNIDLAFSPLLPSIKETLNNWVKKNHMYTYYMHTYKNDFAVLEKAYAWVKEKIGTRILDYLEINSNNMLLLKGFPTAKPYELNAKKPTGNPGEILKISAVDTFLWPAMNHYPQNLQIIPNLQVIAIKHNGNMAGEVIVKPVPTLDKNYVFKDPHNLQLDTAKTYKIHAKNIILCAGAMGSAEILLRSNIPNNNIGKGVILHPSIGVLGLFDQSIRNMEGISASVYATSIPLSDKYFFESMSADPSFIASIHPGTKEHIADTLTHFQNIGGFGIMLVDSVSKDNRVFIDENGQIQVDYKLSKDDIKRFRKAILEGIKILFEQGAKEVFLPSIELIYKDHNSRRFINYDQAKNAVRKLEFKDNLTVLSSAHMQATNKMGSDYKTAVVSPNFKVWNQSTGQEFRNLYVVDSSIFPTSVGANPMQSIYTFAKIFVDHLG